MLPIRLAPALFPVLTACAALLFADAALAQDPEEGDVALNAQTRVRVRSRSTGVRLAVQGRLDAANLVGLSRPDAPVATGLGATLMNPVVTPGVRLLSTRLFLGLGFGFGGVSTEAPNGDEDSRSGFSLVPTATFDLISRPEGALSLGGMLTIAKLGQTEQCEDGVCMDLDNGATGLGLSLLAGLRGNIVPGVAIGADFGWGFMSISADNDADAFIHNVLGMILFEASLGL